MIVERILSVIAMVQRIKIDSIYQLMKRKLYIILALLLTVIQGSWAEEITQWTFSYTGAIQTFTAPYAGIYELKVWGAQGGQFIETAGGLGGYATCRTTLTQGETIYIYVGGKGGDRLDAAGAAGGWNGGGKGGSGVSGYSGSAGGGGATHISKVYNQVIGSGSGQCASLVGTNFIIVAGGGGGAGHPYTSAGNGGGTEGGLGTRHDGSATDHAVRVNYTEQYYYSTSRSYGADGGNGFAESWACEGAGGGGGGYYGGTSNYPNSTFTGACQDAGGCGGNSAYNGSLASNFSTTAGQREGNGQAQIKLLLQGSGTLGDPYLIPSVNAWNFLADQVNAGNNYAGKYFRQTGDFTVSSKILGYPIEDESFVTFNGIYDGNGRTITASISKSDERYVAPFHCIANATIKNVIVTGSVAVSGSASIERRRHPAGLVGVTDGTCIIQNCRVSANISGCDYLGGILGHSMRANLTMTGCVYTGTITASGANYTGGLIGWGGGTSGLNVSIENCLFAGSYSGSGKFHPVGCYYTPDTDSRSVSNTYYTVAATMDENDVSSYVKGLSYKGKMRYSITAGTNVTVANAGSPTNYNISGITSYGTGIMYGDVLYAGNGEAVSLTLSHGSKTGYSFSQYAVTGGGSLDNPGSNTSTLTMTAANQTINAEWTENTATLNQTTDNSTFISTNNGLVYDITLTRTLQTGGWNTFCVPFSIAIPDGWTVRELGNSYYDSTTKALTLNFTNATSIMAGKPYLVKVTSAVENPKFNDVTIVNGTTTKTTTYADFVPVMNPTSVTGGDKTVLFVTGGNKLTYPSSNGNLNGFRAYFQLKGDAAASARSFEMSFDDETDGLKTLSNSPLKGENIYNLAAQRLQKMQRGINIVNGRKVVIKQ